MPCDHFGWSTFCGECGKRYHGGDKKWRTCPNKQCRATVTTDWCPLCGQIVADAALKKEENADAAYWEAEIAMATEVLGTIVQQRPDLAEALGRELPEEPVDRAVAIANAFKGK